jgi:hypothetical protein
MQRRQRDATLAVADDAGMGEMNEGRMHDLEVTGAAATGDLGDVAAEIRFAKKKM